MQINDLMPEQEVLAELGRRLARLRKQRAISQTSLADKAGIGVATLRRIEGGQDSQMASWIKLLKALGHTSAIEGLIPQMIKSPMAEVARSSRRKTAGAVTSTITWGDEKQ